MEIIDDQPMIRNVETDVVVGIVLRALVPDPTDPERLTYMGYKVIGVDGCEIAEFLNERFRGSGFTSLRYPALMVATYEEDRGYPSFKAIAKPPDPFRLEHKLGTLIADTASEICRAYIEHGSGGVKAETKQKYGELMAQLFDIYWASSFQSFNAERRDWEPYFSNAPPSDPRMIFPEAALHYGMFYMERRFPHIDEAALKEVLSWVLEFLDKLINCLFQPNRHLPH